jgi:hypothetical protein
LPEPDQTVGGSIIALKDDRKLRWALAVLEGRPITTVSDRVSKPPFILNQPTPEEIARALELLEPEGLLMVRKDLDDLGDEIRSELRDRLRRSLLPVEWANRLQSILLLMHDARAKHPTGFISRVLLPWIKFRSRLRPTGGVLGGRWSVSAN